MQLLVCAATTMEIQPTLEWISQQKQKPDVLITGVGLTEATYHLTRKIIGEPPGFIIQAGIAGSLDESIAPGEVVIVEKERIGDLGVYEEDRFKDLFQLGLTQMNENPYTNGQLINDRLSKLSSLPYKKVNGVTVNEITTNDSRISHYLKLGAQVESMEGAALHYVGLMEEIPFLQLRAISNYVGERNKKKWVLGESIRILNSELIRIIEILNKS